MKLPSDFAYFSPEITNRNPTLVLYVGGSKENFEEKMSFIENMLPTIEARDQETNCRVVSFASYFHNPEDLDQVFLLIDENNHFKLINIDTWEVESKKEVLADDMKTWQEVKDKVGSLFLDCY